MTRTPAITEAAGLPPEFEALRWFHLPSECLGAAAAPGHGTVT